MLSDGIPNPGTYVIDLRGRVASQSILRTTTANAFSATDILIQDFGKPAAGARKVAETKHLRIITTASTPVTRPGHRIVLSLEINLKPKMHVYAPGVHGYIPIEWKLDESAAGKLQPVAYPASEMLHLEAIGETVPVYRGRVIINREITFGQEAAPDAIGQSGRRIDVEGIIPVSGVR